MYIYMYVYIYIGLLDCVGESCDMLLDVTCYESHGVMSLVA